MSSSRAARFSSSSAANNPAPQEHHTTTIVAEEAATIGLGTREFSPAPPPSVFANNINEVNRDGAGGWDVGQLGRELAGQRGVSGGSEAGGGHGLVAMGVGLSGTVLEELDKIERACSQRSSALKEEEPFVETLGRLDSPVAA